MNQSNNFTICINYTYLEINILFYMQNNEKLFFLINYISETSCDEGSKCP